MGWLIEGINLYRLFIARSIAGAVTGALYAFLRPYLFQDHIYLFVSSLLILSSGIFIFQILAQAKLPRGLRFKFVTVQLAFHYIIASMIIVI